MGALRVAIIGGGLGGLAAALALSAKGVHAKVYEQADQLHEIGAGIVLYPNGLKILDRIGLGPRISRIGTPLGAFRLHAPDGTLVSVERYGSDVGPLGMHRGDLEATIAERRGSKSLYAQAMSAGNKLTTVDAAGRDEVTSQTQL